MSNSIWNIIIDSVKDMKKMIYNQIFSLKFPIFFHKTLEQNKMP